MPSIPAVADRVLAAALQVATVVNNVNYTPLSQALAETLTECGPQLGDGSAVDLQVGDGSGVCPDGDNCDNFYTLINLFRGIDDYNLNQANSQEEEFPSKVNGSRCLSLAAFLAQTHYESAQFTACKERTSPCPDGRFDCSPGVVTDYRPEKQGPGWLPNRVPGTGATGPSQGCTDAWGNVQTDTANCWFGRGAIQITWLPNYARYLPQFIDNPDAICEQGSVGWQGSVAFWQANRFVFDGTCESATRVPNPVFCPQSCQNARCEQQDKIMDVLGVVPPGPPSPGNPTSGAYTVSALEAAGGCWGIMDAVCPGQGNNWSQNLCSPTHAPGVCPNIVGGTVIAYNCNGC